MALTAAEARQRAGDAGIPLSEQTAEVLKLYGWSPAQDDIVSVESVVLAAPARTPEQVKDDAALLLEEARQAQLPAQILQGIGKFAGVALRALAL